MLNWAQCHSIFFRINNVNGDAMPAYLRYKPVVVICKSQKGLDILDTVWGLAVTHYMQLLYNWSSTLWHNPLTKELNLVDM